MSGWVTGKWNAARALATITQHFANWKEVWAAYRSGTAPPPLLTRGGTKLGSLPGCDSISLFWEIWRDRCYTSRGFYQPQPTDTVLDLGANQGFFALFLCERVPGIRVHCFEPAAETRAQLLRNIESNGLGRTVSVYPFAISDRYTEATFHVTANSEHGSLFESQFSGSNAQKVECIPLSRAIELTQAGEIDLLKIDVEGAEIEILEGAAPEIWSRIHRVVVEYHDLFRPGCRDRVEVALRNAGYQVKVIPMPGNPLLGTIEATRATNGSFRK